ncbi:MAG: hypothetical protein LJE94_12305 [Deltaproteobacteria bacterium]|nr:hypothetical protein [Deltaproteobacteria bacterium]
MEENNTWIVCKHVMDGTAEKVQVRRDKVCLCLECAKDATIMETEQICILDEPLLMERLKKISQAFQVKHDGNENNHPDTKK